MDQCPLYPPKPDIGRLGLNRLRVFSIGSCRAPIRRASGNHYPILTSQLRFGAIYCANSLNICALSAMFCFSSVAIAAIPASGSQPNAASFFSTSAVLRFGVPRFRPSREVVKGDDGAAPGRWRACGQCPLLSNNGQMLQCRDCPLRATSRHSALQQRLALFDHLVGGGEQRRSTVSPRLVEHLIRTQPCLGFN
jgi:hypothetical protein